MSESVGSCVPNDSNCIAGHGYIQLQTNHSLDCTCDNVHANVHIKQCGAKGMRHAMGQLAHVNVFLSHSFKQGGINLLLFC